MAWEITEMFTSFLVQNNCIYNKSIALRYVIKVQTFSSFGLLVNEGNSAASLEALIHSTRLLHRWNVLIYNPSFRFPLFFIPLLLPLILFSLLVIPSILAEMEVYECADFLQVCQPAAHLDLIKNGTVAF